MRDVTPGADPAMLPAPSDDPMDDVVTAAQQEAAQQSPASASQRATPSPRTETPAAPASSPERAGAPTERASRKPGRPKKPESIAREIIAEIQATDAADVQVLMDQHAQALANLPDELRTEVATAAMDRAAAGDEADYFDPDTGEVLGGDPQADPMDAEGKPPVGETTGQDDPDDVFAAFVVGMRHAISSERPEFLIGTKNRYLIAAKEMGEAADDAVAEVEAAYAARTRVVSDADRT